MAGRKVMSGKWTYEHCEICLKNAHEKVKMNKSVMRSTDPEGKFSVEMWACPKCGSTKRL